jgi:hypothetical protein
MLVNFTEPFEYKKLGLPVTGKPYFLYSWVVQLMLTNEKARDGSSAFLVDIKRLHYYTNCIRMESKWSDDELWIM